MAFGEIIEYPMFNFTDMVGFVKYPMTIPGIEWIYSFALLIFYGIIYIGVGKDSLTNGIAAFSGLALIGITMYAASLIAASHLMVVITGMVFITILGFKG